MIRRDREVTQWCLTLCDSMDCRLADSSVHGIFQTRVLEWVAISFSRATSRPRDRTQIPPALQADSLLSEPPRVQSLGREDPLEKEMATHSSTLVWKIPWTEEPASLQSMESQRVRHHWLTNIHTRRDKCKPIMIRHLIHSDTVQDWVSNTIDSVTYTWSS